MPTVYRMQWWQVRIQTPHEDVTALWEARHGREETLKMLTDYFAQGRSGLPVRITIDEDPVEAPLVVAPAGHA